MLRKSNTIGNATGAPLRLASVPPRPTLPRAATLRPRGIRVFDSTDSIQRIRVMATGWRVVVDNNFIRGTTAALRPGC